MRPLRAFALLLLPLGVAAAPPTGPRTKVEALWRKLEATVLQVDEGLEGVLGVAIVDLTDGRELLLNADEVFPTASTIKLPLLIELYRQSQAEGCRPPIKAGTEPLGPGRARLSDLYVVRSEDRVPDSFILDGLTPGVSRLTNRDLATCVVAVSDNAATNLLIQRVGLERVEAMLAQADLGQTHLRRRMMDLAAARAGRENVATPRELARLLTLLHHGKLLEPALTEDLLLVLSTPKDGMLARLLPEEVRVASKPGSLEGVRCDAGIIYAAGRPFVVVAMASFLKDDRAGEQAIARVAQVAYRTFGTLGSASPHGRILGVPKAP